MKELNIEKIREDKDITQLINFSILNIDKPSECTSFDVANKVRKMLDLNKTGHLGTLDPNVTGVLPICLGNACKIQEYFMHRDKTYIGKMKLHKKITKKQLEEGMKKFLGKINQLPPRKSRVKRVVRVREVIEFKLLSFNEEKQEAEFISKVEAGTYIRKLISDLGENLKIGAQMTELRRIQAGLFSDKDKEFTSLEKLEEAVKEYQEGKCGKLRKLLVPAEIIITVMPIVEVNSEAVNKLKNGSPIFEEMLVDINKSKKIIKTKQDFCVVFEESLIEIAKFNENMTKLYPNILAKPSAVLISK